MVEDFYLINHCTDQAPSSHSVIYRQSLDAHIDSSMSMIYLPHWRFPEVKKKEDTITPYHHLDHLLCTSHEHLEHHQRVRLHFFTVQREDPHELSENTMSFLFLDFSWHRQRQNPLEMHRQYLQEQNYLEFFF